MGFCYIIIYALTQLFTRTVFHSASTSAFQLATVHALQFKLLNSQGAINPLCNSIANSNCVIALARSHKSAVRFKLATLIV